MGFLSTRTYHFRNLADQEIPLDAKSICFLGRNGQGKTNCLEAVYLLCFGSSFRTRHEKILIRHGMKEMSVTGMFNTGSEADIAQQSVQISIENGKKNIKLNSRKIQDRKEIINIMPCIVFAHEDIFFVNGAPERKRLFINQTMSLSDPLCIDVFRRYRQILKSRNILLKEQKRDQIDVLTYQLAREGKYICVERQKLIDEFNETFVPLYKTISGLQDDLSIKYRSSWKDFQSEEDIAGMMMEKVNRDLEYGTTTSGPHRDNLFFLQNGRDFAGIGSTGQIRLISLVLKTAQAVFFSKKTGKLPILLLDDVLLELDEKRREIFFSCLPDYEQALFTFLNIDDMQYINKNSRMVYFIEEGVVKPWKKQEIY